MAPFTKHIACIRFRSEVINMAKNNNQDKIDGIKKKRLIWGIGILVFVIGFILFTKYGVFEGWRLDKEKANIESEIRTQTFMRDSLRLIIKRLNKDDREIERLARERYGMIKPGEEVLFVPPMQ